MPKIFNCENCGDMITALMDGYGFGDRLLEGVMFKITIQPNDQLHAEAATADDASYLDDLNKEKWLKEAKRFASRNTDVFKCPNGCDPEVLLEERLVEKSSL